MRKALVVAITTVVVVVLLWWSARAAGPDSVAFAIVVVWLPMTGLGTISHVVPFQLPERFHRLRPVELDGRLYPRLGVRVFKRLLRRGPFAVFNPGLHLPTERTAANLARLDARMRVAEASHTVLFVATLGVVVHAAVRGWWGAAATTLLVDVMANGYPVMLQRDNRARLRRTAAAAG